MSDRNKCSDCNDECHCSNHLFIYDQCDIHIQSKNAIELKWELLSSITGTDQTLVYIRDKKNNKTQWYRLIGELYKKNIEVDTSGYVDNWITRKKTKGYSGSSSIKPTYYGYSVGRQEVAKTEHFYSGNTYLGSANVKSYESKIIPYSYRDSESSSSDDEAPSKPEYETVNIRKYVKSSMYSNVYFTKCYPLNQCACKICKCSKGIIKMWKEYIIKNKTITPPGSKNICIRCNHLHNIVHPDEVKRGIDLLGLKFTNCNIIIREDNNIRYCDCKISLTKKELYKIHPKLTLLQQIKYLFRCQLQSAQRSLARKRQAFIEMPKNYREID